MDRIYKEIKKKKRKKKQIIKRFDALSQTKKLKKKIVLNQNIK